MHFLVHQEKKKKRVTVSPTKIGMISEWGCVTKLKSSAELAFIMKYYALSFFASLLLPCYFKVQRRGGGGARIPPLHSPSPPPSMCMKSCIYFRQ